MRILIKNHDLELEKQYPGISCKTIQIAECRAWWAYDMDRPLLMCTTFNNEHLFFDVGAVENVITLIKHMYIYDYLNLSNETTLYESDVNF